MRWLESEPSLRIPPNVEIALLQKALAAQPANAELLSRFGSALQKAGKLHDAAEAYESAAQLNPQGFRSWAGLAECYAKLDLADAALDTCRRADARGPNANIHYWRGRVLGKRKRFDAARDSFLAAIETGSGHIDALKALLWPLAKNDDGGPLLGFCEEISPVYQATALVRAHRAIALSRLGRVEEARQIMDLDRQVARVPIVPPHEFEGIEHFNDLLAEEILADPLQEISRQAFSIDYSLEFRRSSAFVSLRGLMQDAITAYLDEATDRGLDAVMPPPPAEGTLNGATVVLRDDEHNGEHVHALGYVSCVYHVRLPASIVEAGDERGALALGSCKVYTGGHEACWGLRHIKPAAGWLVIFPSHIFHDVVPSLTDVPRISVAADLRAGKALSPVL